MATYNVSSKDQLSKAIIASVEQVLYKVADKVKEEVDTALEDYYSEYDPSQFAGIKAYWYDRTNQLRNCCKISPIIKGLNNISIEIYLDIDSLSYSTPGANPYKTVMAADSGLHGGWNVMRSNDPYQVPFSDLSDDSDYGGTRIWYDPMSKLLEGGKLRELFIKYAKQYGLNLIPS